MNRFLSLFYLLFPIFISCSGMDYSEIVSDGEDEVVTVDSNVVTVFKQPIITIIDDDFNVNHVGKLKTLCDELGIKCDFALTPFRNSYKVYFPQHQKVLIDEYRNEGFGMLLHPVHTYWYTDNVSTEFIDVEHVEASLVETIELFDAENIQYCDCIVYPGNSHETGVREMCSKYLSFGIGTIGEYNVDLSSPFDLERLMLNFTITDKNTVKNIIEEGASKNAWIILGLHCWQFNDSIISDNSTNSWVNLKEVLQFAASKATIMTFGEVIKTLDNPQ